jgi:catechol 2,3-dioxygenase-like lactoylglutathione lyase family enzyme
MEHPISFSVSKLRSMSCRNCRQNGVHIAFQAPDRETVKRFHKMAIANGGTDEGCPGIRENYNANYYGAFVRDPDGNKIEAVTSTARESFQL